jgi:DNA gyrase subunit A
MKLGRLTSMEVDKLLAEYKDLVGKIKKYRKILSEPQEIYRVIKEELKEIEKKYGDKRLTRISSDDNTDFNVADVIPDDEILVAVTNKGYIKATPLNGYKMQNRGGKGVRGIKTSQDDFVTNILSSTRLSKTVIITSKGKAYQINNYELNYTSRDSKGRLLYNHVKMEPDEEVQAVLSARSEEIEDKFLVITTRFGKIKRTAFDQFVNSRISGIKAIELQEGDRVVDSEISSSEDDTVIISTKKGMVIRFPMSQVRPMGRTAMGVIGIKLREGDEVVAASFVSPDDERTLLTATENGVGKRTYLKEYRVQNRAGYGLKNLYGTDSIGEVVRALVVDDDDEVILMTHSSQSIRIPVKSIRITGRITKGVKVVNLSGEDVVTSVARVEED